MLVAKSEVVQAEEIEKRDILHTRRVVLIKEEIAEIEVMVETEAITEVEQMVGSKYIAETKEMI